MSPIPACPKCQREMRQLGRYVDWTCECCDESVKCPHVSRVKRLTRRFQGRKV